jgi:hypothetical protein
VTHGEAQAARRAGSPQAHRAGQGTRATAQGHHQRGLRRCRTRGEAAGTAISWAATVASDHAARSGHSPVRSLPGVR